jgi:hypothetical protein
MRLNKLLQSLYLFTLIFALSGCMVFTKQDAAVKAAKKKEQIDRTHKKAYEKARTATLKHRREIQTKKTQERMDDVNKRAETNNKHDDKKWWEKILKRKRPRSQRRH